MLNFLKFKGVKDVNIYAHNAKYDVSSSAKGILSNLSKQDRCELDGNMIYIKGEFYGMNVKIVDSYKFIATKLEDMSEMFEFKGVEKEIMPYSIFNNANMFGFRKGTEVPIDVINSIEFNLNWNEKKQKQFEVNLEKWDCISEDRQTVNLLEYSRRYCDQDCILLYKSMKPFRQNIYEISQLDILTGSLNKQNSPFPFALMPVRNCRPWLGIQFGWRGV